MNQRAFDKHFAQLTSHINDQQAHEQVWIEEQHSEKLTGRQAVAAAEIAVAWQAIADELDRGRAVSKERIEALREALWQRELLGKPRSRSVKKKTSAQLDAEIAETLRKPTGHDPR